MNSRGPSDRNHKKTISYLIIGVMGVLMVLSHQNCTTGEEAAVGASDAEAGGVVTIIDGSKAEAGGLSFPFNEVQLTTDSTETELKGVCPRNQDDAIIAWTLVDVESGAEVNKGRATCLSGAFMVKAPVSGLPCGQRYKVTARLGVGTPGEVVFSRACAQ